MDGLHSGACGGTGNVQVRTVTEVVCLWIEECSSAYEGLSEKQPARGTGLPVGVCALVQYCGC